MPKITRIEAPVPELRPRKRVAAYARVSMESENLLHSLSAQVSHYSRLIQKNPEWVYAGVYADSGITGTQTDSRKEFLRLIEECEAGKIDIVLVKSISRFARNTVDTLETTRHLKDIGVEVRFERENISSFSGDGELMLTILASYAQEESRSISENVKWATRKRFEQGIPNGHKAPFGYCWDGEMFRIIPEQAEAVRLIFELYLAGRSPFQIRDVLKEKGIKAQGGGDFCDSSIKEILSNISYTGTMILQKNYFNESHKRIINRGELTRYAVEEMFEPIITAEDYDRAQAVRKTRAEQYSRKIEPTCFSGKVKCGCCGGGMSRRTSNRKKKWICNRKERKQDCFSKGIQEDDLMALTREAIGDADFKAKVEKADVYDDKVVYTMKSGSRITKARTYEGKRRGGFSGRLFCGHCGSPVHRDRTTLNGEFVFIRQCSAPRRDGCIRPKLMDDELLKACGDVLGDTKNPEAAFARDVLKMMVYDDRFEFTTREGEVLAWQRK